MNKSKFAVLVAAMFASSLGVTEIAQAQSADSDVPKLVVRYSASILASESGVRALYSRLVTAAEKVCYQPPSGIFPSEAVLACRRQALAGAVAQIHNARLADLSARYAKMG